MKRNMVTSIKEDAIMKYHPDLDWQPSVTSILPIMQSAKHVLVLTGSGLSAESGIPEDEDVLPALRGEVPLQHIKRLETYAKEPELIWGWCEWLRMRSMKAQPNAAHVALTRLAGKITVTLATQNMDDLHERAGSHAVLHLDGYLNHSSCLSCRSSHALPPDIPDEPAHGRKVAPPTCQHCGGTIRPGIIWRSVKNTQAWITTQTVAKTCDVLLLIGHPDTSATQRLAVLVSRRGKPVIKIGNEESTMNTFADVVLKGSPSELLPRLVDCVLQGETACSY